MFTKKTLALLFAGIVLLIGCAPQRIYHAKAIIDIQDIRQAVCIESTINADDKTGRPKDKPWFEVIEGRTPIIVTAPHATRSIRDGKDRPSDGGGTAALAKLLSKLAGVTVLYTSYPSPSDPNYYDNNAFKKRLDELINERRPMLVLDVHASHAYRPYDVDLGTMNGESLQGNEALVENLVASLRREGLTNISYNYFSASKNQTITKYASTRGVPAIQLEISSTWLTPSKDDISAHRFAQLLQALTIFIKMNGPGG